MSVRSGGCPAAIDLEAASAGETLPEVLAHLAGGCATCRARVEELRAATQSFVAMRPAELFLGQLERRAAAAGSSRRRWTTWIVSAGALAAAGLLLAVYPASSPTVTFKGSGTEIHLRRGTETRRLAADEALHPGDALRFSVRAERPGYAVVLERDAAGQVTVVAPFAADMPQRVGAGTTTLADSAVLDDVLGHEVFVSVVGNEPFDVGRLVEQLGAGVAVSCAGCRVEEIRLEKIH